MPAICDGLTCGKKGFVSWADSVRVVLAVRTKPGMPVARVTTLNAATIRQHQVCAVSRTRGRTSWASDLTIEARGYAVADTSH